MDCEQVANLISARIDGEIMPGDESMLDAHLAECAVCRAEMEAIELQDTAMVRAFHGPREAAAALADRVAASFTAPRVESGKRWPLWTGWAVAGAAGFLVAVILMRPRPIPQSTSAALAPELVAHLAVASGEVFTCPSGAEKWEPMTPGTGVAPGSKVRTADAAKCELTLPGGSRVRLNADTELRIANASDVQLTGGQMWSAVAPSAGPLRIAAGDANVTTAGASAQLDIARVADAATVTVVSGAAQVDSPDQRTVVPSGQFLRVGGVPFMGCEPVADAVRTTRWLDDLLLLQSADNPELLDRLDALLARIVVERKNPTASVGPIERDVRSRGESWAAPITRYVIARAAAASEHDQAKRQTAARLLADLATPACLSDLVSLVADGDSEVRFHAAAALNRLTGQTLGFSPDQCAAKPRDPAPAVAWQDWWARNRPTHPNKL